MKSLRSKRLTWAGFPLTLLFVACLNDAPDSRSDTPDPENPPGIDTTHDADTLPDTLPANWQASASASAGGAAVRAAARGDSLFVAVGDSGAVLHSADGVTWSLADTSEPGTNWTHVAWNGSVFVVVGAYTMEDPHYGSTRALRALTSVDGVRWETSEGIALGFFPPVETLVWDAGSGLFLATEWGGKSRAFSTDGVVWGRHARRQDGEWPPFEFPTR